MTALSGAPTLTEKCDLSQQEVVDAFQPRAKLYTVWDTSRTGLGLMIFKDGHRSWVLSYMTDEGARQMGLSDADVMTSLEVTKEWIARRHELQQSAAALLKRKYATITAARPAWAPPVDADALAVDNRALRAEIIRLTEALHHELQRNYALENLLNPATLLPF